MKDIAPFISACVLAIAALIGGLWALLRIWRERTYEAALDIEINSTSAPHDRDYLVFIEVILTNKGRIMIKAKDKRPNEWAYIDGAERLRHSGSLEVRRILSCEDSKERHLDWFESPFLESVPKLDEVNLLSEYECAADKDKIEFWMEPSESYHLGVPIVLPAGLYLIKVTFVAAGGDDNFWSRVHCIQVPEPRQPN